MTTQPKHGHPPQGNVDLELAEKFMRFLNDLLDRDPQAVEALMSVRVCCNPCTVEHPTVQVMPLGESNYGVVGLLGLLNGLCGCWTDKTAPVPELANSGPLVTVTGDDRRLLQFRIRSFAYATRQRPDEFDTVTKLRHALAGCLDALNSVTTNSIIPDSPGMSRTKEFAAQALKEASNDRSTPDAVQ